MSDFRIDKITNRDGSAGTQIAGISTFSGTSGMQLPVGPTEYRGGRGRALWAGGYTPTHVNTIDYVEMATTGNATDFGDMGAARGGPTGGLNNGTRGIIAGGYNGGYKTEMYGVTMSSKGGSFDFGDMINGSYAGNGMSNGVRGVLGNAGRGDNSTQAMITFVNIASAGGDSEFGWNDAARQVPTGVAGQKGEYSTGSSPTRGLMAGGHTHSSSCYKGINYITIMTKGDAIDFGELTTTNSYSGGAANSTRMIVFGGYTVSPNNTNAVNTIEYLTMATLGNATDFGDMTDEVHSLAANATSTRAAVAGGRNDGNTIINTIEYVTISTTGNSANFGDITSTRRGLTSSSDSHGGLGE